MSIDFQWDDPNATFLRVQQMLRTRGDAIARIPDRAIRRGTFELLAAIQRLAPKKTTALVKSLQAAVRKISADVIEGKVGTHLEYAKFVERGTGIYGPHGTPIVPRHAKALRFSPVRGVVIYRKSVRGMKARAPFRTALLQFLPRYAEIIRQELAAEAAQ